MTPEQEQQLVAHLREIASKPYSHSTMDDWNFLMAALPALLVLLERLAGLEKGLALCKSHVTVAAMGTCPAGCVICRLAEAEARAARAEQATKEAGARIAELEKGANQ